MPGRSPRRRRRAARRSDRLLTLALVCLALVVGAFVSSVVHRWTGPLAGGPSPPSGGPTPGEGAAPGPAAAPPRISDAGTDRGRIRIEVLNAARVPGLADRMTDLLRSRGFDVVSYDNAATVSDTSLILDRVGNALFAREVALALPGTPIRRQLSRDQFVDVTLLVGRDYQRYFATAAEPETAPARPGLLDRLRHALGL